MKKETYIPAIITLAAIVILLLWSPSPWITGLFSFFMIVSLFFYILMYRPDETQNLKLAQWYFIALAIQCVHFIEEYVGMIYIELPSLLDIQPIGQDAFVLFNLGAYAIFILGGIALFRNYHGMMVIPIFFILMGVMANGIIHVLLALWQSSYFPGLYTALAYLVLGPYLIKLLLGGSGLKPMGSGSQIRK